MRIRRVIGPVLLLALALALSACTTLNYGLAVDKPILTDRSLKRPHRIVTDFKEYNKRVYLFWGLWPIAGQNGSDLLAHHIGDGDGIVNLTAYEKFDLLDFLIGGATTGIISTRTVEVRGNNFVYAEPPLPPPPPPVEEQPLPPAP